MCVGDGKERGGGWGGGGGLTVVLRQLVRVQVPQ